MKETVKAIRILLAEDHVVVRERAFEQADIALEKVSEVLATLTERLDNADYELKQLALEALSVKANIYPDGSIRIDGSIPTEANCVTQGKYLGNWYSPHPL